MIRHAPRLVAGLWLALVAGQAQAREQVVELSSPGTYVSMPLPADTQDVELQEQRAGACRFNRTWGFDLTNRELWVNGGCAASFKVLLRNLDQPSSNESNVGAAVAAAAAIAGIAILASRDRDDRPDYRPPPTYPGYPPPGYPGSGARTIRGVGNLCLDMRGDVREGTPAILYNCHGRGNQRFEWLPSGEIRVQGYCLDVAGSNHADGAAVVAWGCNGGRNQRWYVEGAVVRSRLHGKCLTVWGAPRPETPVAMQNCRGQPNQRWYW